MAAQYLYGPVLYIYFFYRILTAGVSAGQTARAMNKSPDKKRFLEANIYSFMDVVCWMAFETTQRSVHGVILPVRACLLCTFLCQWHVHSLCTGTPPQTARGYSWICQNLLSFPPSPRRVVANRQVEMTDVKIYLEANHATNRGAEIPARFSAWPPSLQSKPFMGDISGLPLTAHSEPRFWELLFGFSLDRKSSRVQIWRLRFWQCCSLSSGF